MTVDEAIAKLAALSPEERALPLVASMWNKALSDFHALGDVVEVYYEGGEFVQVMGVDPRNPLDTVQPQPRCTQVYVVRPGDMSDDVAVFEHEDDAEAFRSTYENVSDVETAVVCDHELARQMVRDREDDQAEDDREARPWVVGETALADGGEGGVIDRFETHDEAAAYIDTLDPAKRDRGDYYIDGPERGEA